MFKYLTYIKEPIIDSKKSKGNIYKFKIAKEANKSDIKKSIEILFEEIKVLSVRIVTKGYKESFFRRRYKFLKGGYKYCYITTDKVIDFSKYTISEDKINEETTE